MVDSNDLRIEIGQRIKFIREQRNISRQEIGVALGHSAKYFYDVETGNRGMSLSSLIEIADYLGISTDYLLTGQYYPPKYAYFFEMISLVPPEDEKEVKEMILVLSRHFANIRQKPNQDAK